VTTAGGDSLAGGFASAAPVGATPITIGGSQGFLLDKESSYATIGWTTGEAAITLSGPVSHGDTQSLVTVADSLVLLSTDDPRIVAPADCQVPPGSTCPSESPTPSPSPGSTATATAIPSSTSVPSDGSPGIANPIPSPSPTAG
jgi:hypothetical protein